MCGRAHVSAECKRESKGACARMSMQAPPDCSPTQGAHPPRFPGAAKLQRFLPPGAPPSPLQPSALSPAQPAASRRSSPPPRPRRPPGPGNRTAAALPAAQLHPTPPSTPRPACPGARPPARSCKAASPSPSPPPDSIATIIITITTTHPTAWAGSQVAPGGGAAPHPPCAAAFSAWLWRGACRAPCTWSTPAGSRGFRSGQVVCVTAPTPCAQGGC